MNKDLFSPDGHHVTQLQNLCNFKLEQIYSYVEFGQVYWVDFGEGYGSEIPYQRPAVIIQDNYYNDQTVLVVPLSSKPAEYYNQIINPTIDFSDKKLLIGDISADPIKFGNSKFLFNHIQAVDLSRLRKYLFTIRRQYLKKLLQNALSCICGIFVNPNAINTTTQTTSVKEDPQNDSVKPKEEPIKSTEASILKNNSNENENTTECTSTKPIKVEPLPFDTKHFSKSQKKIYGFITPEFFSELKYSTKPQPEKIKDFLQASFNFNCTDETLDLITDCIICTIHSKNKYFDLCEFARKKSNSKECSLNYETIVNNISEPIQYKFFGSTKVKVSEFISFISMIISTCQNRQR